MKDANRRALFGAAVVTVLAASLYFLTAARDIVVGDTPELITAAAALGVAHPPGYPLFTMLGHFFSLIPVGSIPFRVNLFSVVCDSIAAGVVYLITQRLTKSHRAGGVSALLLAVNPIFWEWSLAAEVFPLNNLLAAVLILLLIGWSDEAGPDGLLIAASFVFGLGLTNQLTIVLLFPAFCFILWRRRSDLFPRPKLAVIGAVAFLIGLVPYAYIPWASSQHPVYNWGDVLSFQDLIRLVTRKGYGSLNLVSTPGYTGGSPWPRLFAFTISFVSAFGLLIIIGAVRAFREARSYFWFTLIAFVFVGPFFIWITNLNLTAAPSALFVLQRFFLLSQVVLAPLVGFAVVALAEFVARTAGIRSSRAAQIATTACLACVLIYVASHYRRLDLSKNAIARRFGEDAFHLAPSNSILLVTGDGFAFPMLYLQKIEHVRSDVTLVVLPMLLGEWYARQLRAEHPDLVIPFDRYDRSSGNLKALVEANPGRTIALAGTLGDDHSLDADYWPYQQGLLAIILPKSQDRDLGTLLSENERLFNSCHPPAPQSVRMETFESDIVSIYSFPALRLGGLCEGAGLKDDARTWYERALTINPQFSQARQALARLEH